VSTARRRLTIVMMLSAMLCQTKLGSLFQRRTKVSMASGGFGAVTERRLSQGVVLTSVLLLSALTIEPFAPVIHSENSVQC